MPENVEISQQDLQDFLYGRMQSWDLPYRIIRDEYLADQVGSRLALFIAEGRKSILEELSADDRQERVDR